MMAMTIATIGRLMKNLATASPPSEAYTLPEGADSPDVAALPSEVATMTTFMPDFTICRPPTTTFSPGLSPLSTTHSESTRSAGVTPERISTVPSTPTTATWKSP